MTPPHGGAGTDVVGVIVIVVGVLTAFGGTVAVRLPFEIDPPEEPIDWLTAPVVEVEPPPPPPHPAARAATADTMEITALRRLRFITGLRPELVNKLAAIIRELAEDPQFYLRRFVPRGVRVKIEGGVDYRPFRNSFASCHPKVRNIAIDG